MKTSKIIGFLESGIAAKKLPTRMGYAIHVNNEAFKPALTAFETKKKELVDKYAEKDKDGNPVIEDNRYTIKDVDGWNKDMQELLDMEVDVNITKIPVDVLDKCDLPEFDSLEIWELSAIDFMIE